MLPCPPGTDAGCLLKSLPTQPQSVIPWDWAVVFAVFSSFLSWPFSGPLHHFLSLSGHSWVPRVTFFTPWFHHSKRVFTPWFHHSTGFFPTQTTPWFHDSSTVFSNLEHLKFHDSKRDFTPQFHHSKRMFSNSDHPTAPRAKRVFSP